MLFRWARLLFMVRNLIRAPKAKLLSKSVKHCQSALVRDGAEGNAASTIDAIPKVLEFLRSSLKESSGPAAAPDVSKAAKPAN